jgi:hypothetical protein
LSDTPSRRATSDLFAAFDSHQVVFSLIPASIHHKFPENKKLWVNLEYDPAFSIGGSGYIFDANYGIISN